MDLKSIKNLISIFENSQLGEMEVESGDAADKLRVTLKKNSSAATGAVSVPAAPAAVPQQNRRLDD